MTTKTIKLNPEDFFHARPSTIVCSEAKKYKSVILLSLGMEIADAKEVFSIMRLSRPNGRSLDVMADGPDEKDAVAAIEAAVAKAFSMQ